ncbi:MAG: hypothetical protein ACRD1L_00985 [Terriglobales bacterium]
MQKTVTILACLCMILGVLPEAVTTVQAQAGPYLAMAPLKEYLIPQATEIALARSAAPASIADHATVLVLGPQGYTTAVQGTNGFVCDVERSWANDTDSPQFWNPKMRGPNCFNPEAAKRVVPIYEMKTRLVLAGKSRTEIAQAIAAALGSGALASPAGGGMCYMMSKQQYLNDQGKNWHPHVMFYAAGDVASDWGGNLQGSPMIAVHDPESRLTTFMIVLPRWSDGTPDLQ